MAWQYFDPDVFHKELVDEIRRRGFVAHLFPTPDRHEYEIYVENYDLNLLCKIVLYSGESRLAVQVSYECEEHTHAERTFAPVRVRAKTLATEILSELS